MGQQQTRWATAPKTGTFRVTQQNAVSKDADWKSVFSAREHVLLSFDFSGGNLFFLRHGGIIEEVP